MKRISVDRIPDVFSLGLWRVLFLFLLCLASSTETLAQNVQQGNDAIDMGMRSSRKVNPNNLAMELKIPLVEAEWICRLCFLTRRDSGK
jgi:hypothetical protein